MKKIVYPVYANMLISDNKLIVTACFVQYFNVFQRKNIEFTPKTAISVIY